MQGKIYLVIGGTRSGKSFFAEQMVEQFSSPVVYIATAEVNDDEMQQRVELHQKRRPASWQTVEEPYQIAKFIRETNLTGKTILLDCLTVYISNLLWKNSEADEEEQKRIIFQELGELQEAIIQSGATFVIVSSEVGLGLVPESRLGRLYRDVVGEANQKIGAAAEEIYFVFAGIPISLKALQNVNYFEKGIRHGSINNK
ncbi:bifunctional adenosylcobinamide kinase/adenosylcobinamide-phosphate guanylyltransferase [Bacillota bacterium LX-D]|nr:bifunctional adenosylcobinamide kinase/adenosylcobinamide-phosphate guanylyltransferase [Bacillota bacterium LX-D]